MKHLLKNALFIVFSLIIAVSSVACSTDGSGDSNIDMPTSDSSATNNTENTDDYQSPLKQYIPYISIENVDNANNLVNNNVIKELETYTYQLETAPDPAQAEFTINFLGKQLTGQYTTGYNSKKTERRNHYRYNYQTENGEKFSINENGLLTSWTGTKNSNQCIPSNSSDAIDLEQAISICKELLPQEFYAKFPKYTIEIFSDPNTTPDSTAYSIAFVSLYDGIKVSHQVNFTLGLNGELLNYGTINLGRFDAKLFPADFDQQKINEILDNVFVKANTQYEIYRTTITLMSDNTLACSVGIMIYEGGEYLTSIAIDIPLE